jgi:hypothetical protein
MLKCNQKNPVFWIEREVNILKFSEERKRLLVKSSVRRKSSFKRVVVTVLCIVLMFSLTACGGTSEGESKAFCHNCNKEISSESNFCPHCGATTKENQPSSGESTASTRSPEMDEMVAQSKQNVEPYLEVMGADVTNGNPPVSQDFIDNLNSVEIMGHVGSVEHGYNIYDGRSYIEIMTWESNKSTANDDFFVFVELMDEYFGQKSVLVSYDHIDDEIYGWVESSKQFSVITYFDNGKIYLQWDVRLEFEDEESLRVVEPDDDYASSTKGEKCVECGTNAYFTYTNPFSGKDEGYCYTHYQEILDIMGMMGEDVGNSNYRKHTCEECSREGTHRYESFTGQTEYYCTTHYNELMELLDSLGIE